MREIKFRGIRIDNGEWVYGDLVHMAHDGINKIIDIGIREICSYPFEVNPETVGQFTGFTDVNDKEIFEGDNINSGQNDFQPTEVYWDEQLGSWATTNYHSTLSLPDSMDVNTVIIGNIHQP